MGTSDNDGPRDDNTSTPPKEKKESVENEKKHKYGYHKPMIPRQPKFEGKCDDLKGHIYDCSDVRQSDIFMKTTKETGEFVGGTYKYGGDIRLVVENLELPVMAEPSDRPEKHNQDSRKDLGKAS